MAGRCGCSSVNATGASLDGGACVNVTGAGTPDSPAVIGVVIDPDDSNNLQCSGAGLFAANSQVEGSSCVAVAGDGSFATPYVVTVVIDPVDGNQVSCGDDGLLVPLNSDIKLVGIGNTIFGGSPPSVGDGGWKKYAGTYAAATDIDGAIVVPLPVGMFPNGIITVLHSDGDVTTVPHFIQLRVADTNLSQLAFLVRDFDGTTSVGVNIRVNYEVIGW